MFDPNPVSYQFRLDDIEREVERSRAAGPVRLSRILGPVVAVALPPLIAVLSYGLG